MYLPCFPLKYSILYNNRTEAHFHNSFEFTFIESGEFTATIHAVNIRLKAGDCILVSPSIVHDLTGKGNDRFFTAVFSADFVMEFFRNTKHVSFYKFTLEKSALNYLKEYMMYTGTPKIYTLKSCLYAICSNAVNHSTALRDQDIDSNFLLAVNNYIARHLNQPFMRKDIARALNYEEHYFSDLFNRNFQMGLNQYINLFRFRHACELLTQSNANIADIAFESGFSSIRSFNRIFKEFSGKTPKEYRNSELLVTEADLINERVAIPKSSSS